MSQSTKKSMVESMMQTFIGTVFGFLLAFIIFPMFGVYTSVQTISGITIVFMFVGIFKNFLIRRFFNWMHHHPEKFKFLRKKQRWNQSLIESSSQTIIGTVVSFLLSLIIYPMFGLYIPVIKITGITLVFMVTSVLKNYFIRRYFENVKINIK